MLLSFVVSLRPHAPTPMQPGTGKALNGLFYHLAQRGDPHLSEQVHDDGDGVRPFTVSPLRGTFRQMPGGQVAMPGETYWVRYTSLDDRISHAVLGALEARHLFGEAITLRHAEYQLVGVELSPADGRQWAGMCPPDTLWQQSGSDAVVALRFHSATAFTRRGLTLLFPEPFNVWQSYREKWNRVCAGDPALAHLAVDDGFLPWVEQHVAVEAHELQTAHVPFGGFGARGFLGWTQFVVAGRDRDSARLKQWNALADFAFFGGTGMKTTQGMGQTARMIAGGQRSAVSSQ